MMLALLSYIWESLSDFFAKFTKLRLRYVTKTGEIERICKSYHNSEMSIRFAKSFRNSRQLSTYSKIVFYPKLFSVRAVFQNIVKIKHIQVYQADQAGSTTSTKMVSMNIMHCLHSLRYVNAVINHLEKIQRIEVMKQTNAKHSALLEEFWLNMTSPSCPIESAGTRDWGIVGFQGKDPSTDFRGMGLLGLEQLLYFSKYDAARDILQDSDHPRRFYPFACTGINISAFVLELLRGRHLHLYLLRTLEANSMNMSVDINNSDSPSPELLLLGCNTVHDIYCEIFKRFSEVWQQRDPPHVMHFNEIFSDVKIEIKRKYPSF